MSTLRDRLDALWIPGTWLYPGGPAYELREIACEALDEIERLRADRLSIARQITDAVTKPIEPRTYAPLLSWAQAALRGEEAKT